MVKYDFDNVDLAIIFIGLICLGFSVPHLLKGGNVSELSNLIGQCVLAIAALATGKQAGKNGNGTS